MLLHGDGGHVVEGSPVERPPIYAVVEGAAGFGEVGGNLSWAASVSLYTFVPWLRTISGPRVSRAGVMLAYRCPLLEDNNFGQHPLSHSRALAIEIIVGGRAGKPLYLRSSPDINRLPEMLDDIAEAIPALLVGFRLVFEDNPDINR